MRGRGGDSCAQHDENILGIGQYATWGSRTANFMVIGYGSDPHHYHLAYVGTHHPELPPEWSPADKYHDTLHVYPNDNVVVWSPRSQRWVDIDDSLLFRVGDHARGRNTGRIYLVTDYNDVGDIVTVCVEPGRGPRPGTVGASAANGAHNLENISRGPDGLEPVEAEDEDLV